MTIQEIIKWLESLKAEIGKSEHRTLWHYAEAIDRAIEALQTKGVGRYENAMQKLREMPRYLNGVKEKRKAEPVKHGEWEQHDGCVLCEDDDTYFYTCSCCKMAITEAERGLFNYCPNCGAKMKGGDTE